MNRPAASQLVVLARWPAPGRCKRRLATSLGAVVAARIQARLTGHTLAVARPLASQLGIELVLAVDGLAPGPPGAWATSLGWAAPCCRGEGGWGCACSVSFGGRPPNGPGGWC